MELERYQAQKGKVWKSKIDGSILIRFVNFR